MLRGPLFHEIQHGDRRRLFLAHLDVNRRARSGVSANASANASARGRNLARSARLEPRQGITARAAPGTANIGQFFRRKHAHNAVLAVIAALTENLAAPHAGHGFAQGFPMGAHLSFGHAAEDIQFRPKLAQKSAVPFLNLAGCNARAHNFAHHLGQRNERACFGFQRELRGFLTVSQFPHTVQHAHCERLAANRADVAESARFARFQHHIAGPVPVQVVLAFVGVEFHGAEKAAVEAVLRLTARRCPQGSEHACVGGPPVKKIGFAAKIGPRMGVGVGDKRVAVKLTHKAVHVGIRGKTGLKGKNVIRKIAVAVCQAIKARFGAEKREPGRPHMGRNHDGVVRAFQHDFKQIARIKAKDGPPVGMQVADLFQALRKLCRVLQGTHEDEIVHLAHLAVALVNGADLCLEHKERALRVAALHGPPGHDVKLLRFALEAVESAGFIKLKLLAKLGAPLRMGKVARAQDAYALAARPCGQMAGVEGLAGGAGKTGMDMQVGYEVHTRLFVMVR